MKWRHSRSEFWWRRKKVMVQSQTQKKQLAWPTLIVGWAVSATIVLITQFSLSLVVRFHFASSLLTQLFLSGSLSFSLPKSDSKQNLKGLVFTFMFHRSFGSCGGFGSWRMVQASSGHPWFSFSFCFLYYNLHLVLLYSRYQKRYANFRFL